MTDAILLLPHLYLIPLPITQADKQHLGRVNPCRQFRKNLPVAHSHTSCRRHGVITCIDITRQCNIRMSVNPNHRHITIVFICKIREGHHACRTFSSKRDYLVRILNVQYIQGRFGLGKDSLLIQHTIRHFPLHKIRGHRDCKCRLSIVRSKKVQQLRPKIVSSRSLLRILHFRNPVCDIPALPLRIDEPDCFHCLIFHISSIFTYITICTNISNSFFV